MEQGNFAIDWKDFKALSTKRFEDLEGKHDFSDVTLVCGDGQRIAGHQVILATGCTFFKNLLEGETNPKPLIFLRGVEADLLQPLLDFLYTGKAEISGQLITEFLVLAEDLGIEGLANNPGKETANEALGLADFSEVGNLTNIPKTERVDEWNKETSKDESSEVVSEKKDEPIKKNLERHSTLPPKICPECNKAFNDASNLKRHIASHTNANRRVSSNAETITVPARSDDGLHHCQYCEYKTKDSSNIRRHIRKHHTIPHQNQMDQKDFDFSANSE